MESGVLAEHLPNVLLCLKLLELIFRINLQNTLESEREKQRDIERSRRLSDREEIPALPYLHLVSIFDTHYQSPMESEEILK